MWAVGRPWNTGGQKWAPPPPPPPQSEVGGYGGERFWEAGYRNNPGMATIMDALGRHNAMIGDRVSSLREAAAQAQQAQQPMTHLPDGTAIGQPMPPLQQDKGGTGFMDWLRTKYLGPDQQFQMGDLAKIGRGALGLMTNPLAFGLSTAAGYGWDQLKNNGGLGNLFGGFDAQGNPGAASEAYLENLRGMGLGLGGDPSGRGMVDPSGGMMGQRSGAPMDPGMAGFNAGPDWTRPDATGPGIPGFGSPGGGGGYGGLPPGMSPNPMNPNISMDWSYMLQPAGGGPGIPVISGPQWIGPQPTMSGYPLGQEPWMMGGNR